MLVDDRSASSGAVASAPQAELIRMPEALPAEERFERADGRPTLRHNLAKLIRYSATSGIALGVSEAVLLVLYATKTFNATDAALIANLIGTVPSYLLSRYWIWKNSDRRRVGRQVVQYWATSVVSMLITSLSTGAITSLSPSGHRTHVLVAGAGFLTVSLVLWVAKYLVYQKVIFKEPATVAAV